MSYHRAPAVVCMVMGVNNGMDRFRADVAEKGRNLRSCLFTLSGVNDDETKRPFNQNGIGKGIANCHPHPLSDLLPMETTIAN